MRTDITCALGGVSLHELDSRIFVENIKETPNTGIETAKRSGYGTFPMAEPERISLVITVTVYVKERDRTARQAVIDAIKGWCGQGWFTKSTKPGKRIYVFCTKMPEEEAFDVSSRMEIEFTAYGEAYWQNTNPSFVVPYDAVSSGNATLKTSGTQDCFLEATITPSGGTLTSVSISVGNQRLELTGLSVANETQLRIYYDEMHILRIVNGSTSLISKKTADSSDDILLPPNASSTISFTFNTNCYYQFMARGLWK